MSAEDAEGLEATSRQIDLLGIPEYSDHRHEFPIPNDLRLKSIKHLKASRRKLYRDVGEADEERQRERFEEHDVPKALYPWVETTEGEREKMLTVLEYLDEDGPADTVSKIAEDCSITRSRVPTYKNNEEALGTCIVEDEGEYTITLVDEEAVRVPRDDVVVV